MAGQSTDATVAEAVKFCEGLGLALDADALDLIAAMAADGQNLAAIFARLSVVERALTLVKAVRAAIETGEIPAQFDRGDKLQKLITTGLSKHDPRIGFQATLRSAYNAGRYQRGIEDLTDQPYFLYRTMRDARVRTSHQILNGVYLPKDHPWWSDHYPSNGWRCRCIAISADQKGIDRLAKAGILLQDTAPEEAQIEYKDKVTGKTVVLPASIEPGWDFNPGTPEGERRMADMLKRQLQALADA